jgi:hypothetical protein
VLMSARCVVASRGTFVPTIAQLSKRIRAIYFFERDGNNTMRKLGIEVRTIKDCKGAYVARIMEGNWTGSSEQRKLMLTYPQENFNLEIQPATAGDQA